MAKKKVPKKVKTTSVVKTTKNSNAKAKTITKLMAQQDLKDSEIRETAIHMKEKGVGVHPASIIESLKKQGIVVSSPQVSMVLKKMGFLQDDGESDHDLDNDAD